jgi:hypothetical protein
MILCFSPTHSLEPRAEMDWCQEIATPDTFRLAIMKDEERGLGHGARRTGHGKTRDRKSEVRGL